MIDLSPKIKQARDNGYSDDEIMDFLGSHENFSPKIQQAKDNGYSNEDILEYLGEGAKEPEQAVVESGVRKGGRLAAQGGIGLIENATMPYNLGAIGVQTLARNPLIKKVHETEELNPELTKKVQQQQSPMMQQIEGKFRQNLEEQDVIRQEDPVSQFIQKQGLDVGSVLETAFQHAGIDMKPEDASEMAVRWMANIKDPKKLAELSKSAWELAKDPKSTSKFLMNLLPSGKEAARGIGAAAALNVAAENDLGPIGTLVAAVVGDILGGGAIPAAKAAGKAFRHPVETARQLGAKAVTLGTRLSGQEKLALQKDLIESFRKAGIQADVGTLTDSNLVKSMQARLSQSGLVGRALDELKTNMTNDIVSKYKELADQLGEAKFSTIHEAGQALQEMTRGIRDLDLGETRQIYDKVRQSAKNPNAQVHPERLIEAVKHLEENLKPGTLKSAGQKAVLDYIEKLKADIMDENGHLKLAKVNDLMNNKIALNDIISYEVQGGAKQLLKPLVGEIDRAILQHGRHDAAFAKNYVEANKRFSQHAKTFRNKRIDQILRGQDPTSLMNKMNTVQGIRDIKNALNKTPEGRKLFNDLKRFKFDQIIFNNMIDGATNQLKFGKFSNILEKGSNRAIIQEIMGPTSFKRLVGLQKATGKIAESAQKFFNASKSGVVAGDAVVIVKALTDLSSLFAGNPWPLLRTAGGITGARYLSKLLADPEFLRLVEESILMAPGKVNVPKMTNLMERLDKSIRSAIVEAPKEKRAEQVGKKGSYRK